MQTSSVAIDVEDKKLWAPSPYAYVFYATQNEYACSVLVNIERLQNKFNTTHRIFVLATSALSPEYLKAFENRNVTVSVEQPPPLAEGGTWYYQDCLLKLFAFKMHKIDPTLKRVLMLDSDQLILKNLDDLFEDLPEVDLASPRAYWVDRRTLSSTFMMIFLSDRLWSTVETAIKNITKDKYDMDLVNDVLGDTVMMLPGNFVTLNSHFEEWNLPKWYHKEGKTSADQQQQILSIGDATVPVDASRNTNDLVRRNLEDRDTDEASEGAEDAKLMEQTGEEAVEAQAPTAVTSLLMEDATTDDSLSRQGDYWEGKSLDSIDDRASGDRLPATYPTPIPLPEPVDLFERPLYQELFDLYSAASVLHFFALGKPWNYPVQMVRRERPQAHPVFELQFRTWRETAKRVCPAGVVDIV